MQANQERPYKYTNNWFTITAKNVWDLIIPQMSPSRILEIGSYEGASTCYLIDSLSQQGPLEIHCIDSWEGGIEHKNAEGAEAEMAAVEQRFLHNTRLSKSMARNTVDLQCHKGYSDTEMAKLMAAGLQGYFDLIYIDGSHQAPDVLCDAVLSFRLLKIGGFIIFDDYLWSEPLSQGVDPVRCPKMAIDAFTNIYCRKTRIFSLPLSQLYLQKTSD